MTSDQICTRGRRLSTGSTPAISLPDSMFCKPCIHDPPRPSNRSLSLLSPKSSVSSTMCVMKTWLPSPPGHFVLPASVHLPSRFRREGGSGYCHQVGRCFQFLDDRNNCSFLFWDEHQYERESSIWTRPMRSGQSGTDEKEAHN